MTRSLVTIADSASVDEAMHRMREADISSIVVEPGETGQWGIMTRRDIVTKIVRDNKSTAQTKVGQIASRPLITVPPETSLNEAAQLIGRKNISRLLVEQNGKIIGIVTETDIFQSVERFGWLPPE
ncbi:MAG TPA: CBS domain-containing protein [Nevskiales bacterium]|nr:CBS domain-containing protein [Nevskiales bacterium]